MNMLHPAVASQLASEHIKDMTDRARSDRRGREARGIRQIRRQVEPARGQQVPCTEPTARAA